MRRILSLFGVALAAAAFVLICLSPLLKTNFIIPLLMFVGAFALLGVVKSMPGDDSSSNDESGTGGEEK